VHFAPLIAEDGIAPAERRTTCQPFLMGNCACPVWQVAREAGAWPSVFTVEQTALALSRVTAGQVLPPLLPLACGTDLLQYMVNLRNHLDSFLVDELTMVLKLAWRDLGWEQIGSTTYLCVIGAGVAACIDTMVNAERLYLRYASDVEHALYLAGRTLDLPRSRLFLQSTLYERFEVILVQVRSRTWNWLTD
jgi:hypothetical protein